MRRYRPVPAVVSAIVVSALVGGLFGKSIAEFKKASNELKSTLEEEIRLEETRSNLEASRAASQATAATTVPHVEDVPVRKVDHSA